MNVTESRGHIDQEFTTLSTWVLGIDIGIFVLCLSGFVIYEIIRCKFSIKNYHNIWVNSISISLLSFIYHEFSEEEEEEEEGPSVDETSTVYSEYSDEPETTKESESSDSYSFYQTTSSSTLSNSESTQSEEPEPEVTKRETDQPKTTKYGMISTWKCLRKCGPTILFLYRSFNFLHSLGWLVYTLISYQLKKGHPFILNFKHLTMTSYAVMVFHYFLSTLFSALDLCSKRSHWIKDVLEYIVRLFFILSFISSQMTTLSFWLIQFPVLIHLNKFILKPNTIPMHGINSIATIFELLLLHEVKFPPFLALFSGMYPFLYIIWVTFLVKTNRIPKLPYDGLMSVDIHYFAFFVRFGLGFLFPLMHLMGTLVLFGRDIVLQVFKKRSRFKKKKEFDEISKIIKKL